MPLLSRHPYRHTHRHGRRQRSYRRSVPRFHGTGHTHGRISNFKRSYLLNYTVTDSAFQETDLKFMLSYLPSSSEFTTLFDQYRIVGVRAKFMYCFDTFNCNTSGLSFMPILNYYIDYNDVAPLGTSNLFLQREDLVTRPMNKAVSVYIRPRPTQATYQGGAFAAWCTQNQKVWIDTAYPSAEYYGLKWYIYNPVSGGGSASYGNLTVMLTYYVQCRDIK